MYDVELTAEQVLIISETIAAVMARNLAYIFCESTFILAYLERSQNDLQFWSGLRSSR